MKLHVVGIGLIAVAFVAGQLAENPMYYGVPEIVAHWFGLVGGVTTIIARFLPMPSAERNDA